MYRCPKCGCKEVKFARKEQIRDLLGNPVGETVVWECQNPKCKYRFSEEKFSF